MNTILHDGGAASDTAPIRSNAIARIGQRCESAIKWGTELLAVCLLVTEVGLLLINVFFRYVMHQPLVWGDMAMLGALPMPPADIPLLAALATALG